MRYIHFSVSLIILSTLLLAWTGCRPDRISSHPSKPQEAKDAFTTEVTVGGKVWNINPDLSYRATGVWINPNPRQLTDTEKERLQALPDLINKKQRQLDELNKELGYLRRIEKPQIKVHYNFGKPPYPVVKPSDFSSDKIIDLGEFSLELEPYTKTPTTK